MSATSRRSERRALLAVLCAALTAACYPELDWREVGSAESGYAVLLPAKPDRATREVAIGAARVALHMQSVHKDGMAFGAAHADLPPGTGAGQLLDDARDALVRNIGGRVTSEQALAIAGASGRAFTAEGSAAGEPMRLAARVIVANDRFFQVVFVGRVGRGTAADVDMFLESFRLLPRRGAAPATGARTADSGPPPG